jgi:hypothetical protein
MRQLYLFLYLGTLTLFCACSPVIKTKIFAPRPVLEAQENVAVFWPEKDTIPDHLVIGKVCIGNSGLKSNCTLPAVLEKAKAEARRAGGNALMVIEHQLPDGMVTCHQVVALILEVDPGKLPFVEPVPVPEVKATVTDLSPP